MFAILISNENMPKILESVTPTTDHHPDFQIFLNSEKTWYLVTGWVGTRGDVIDWTIMPAYMLEEKFEYDPNKIKTDWDQIVRK
jgi:hypothetical protein